VTKQGGSINLVFRTTLKLKEHVYPNKYPIPLLEPIPPLWRVEKLKRKELDRGIPIIYTKPKWLLENEKKASE
jgi:large subunit ribosomal protein L15